MEKYKIIKDYLQDEIAKYKDKDLTPHLGEELWIATQKQLEAYILKTNQILLQQVIDIENMEKENKFEQE